MPTSHPIIAATVYRKTIPQRRRIDVYGLMPSYTEAIVKAGGIPLLIPLGLPEQDLLTILDRADGLILPGGADVDPFVYSDQRHPKVYGIDPERDRTELFVAQAAVAQRKPFLAICRGIQVLNIALGGSLWQDIPAQIAGAVNHDTSDDRPRNYLAHTVSLQSDSLLARLMDQRESWVNSYHHQSLRDLAPELVVTATAEDGVIEAVEIPGQPYAVGVQWHPENLVDDDPAMLAIFAGLVEAAAQDAAERSDRSPVVAG